VLLGRRADDAVQEAVRAVGQARVVVTGSPVYRASYSGLLKTFFDLLPPDALRNAIAVPVLTGGSPDHRLALAHALGPLFASLGAIVVASGVYACDAQFGPGPDAGVLRQVEQAIADAVHLATAAPGTARSPSDSRAAG
jgi:FMN reductase